MPFVETALWTIEIPPEWLAEEEDDVVAIIDPDDLGALEITALQKEQGNVDLAELAGFSSELINEGNEPAKLSMNNFQGLYFQYNKEELHWREWLLCSGSTLIFATYTTELEHEGLDDVIVDQILDTLTLN